MAHETILVIDDESLIRRTIARRLTNAGFEVLEACTADEGATRIAETEIDAIITDVEMPGAIDGVNGVIN